MNNKSILLILDGWGIGKPDKFNAIANAYTPNMDIFMQNYGYYLCQTYGHFVGLSDKNFGTSETNHMTIGVGEVIWQDLPKIDKEIEEKKFDINENLHKFISQVKSKNSVFHIESILSDGGVHCHMYHLIYLIKLLQQNGILKIHLHLFADGRDVAPRSVLKYLDILKDNVKLDENIFISTFAGRFWLDRDRDWSRSEILVDKIIGNDIKITDKDIATIVAEEYKDEQLTDERIGIYKFSDYKLSKDDIFFCTHYRSDRAYQLLKTLQNKLPNLMIGNFSAEYDDINQIVIYPRDKIKTTLSTRLEENNKSQVHITETEKYTHLTYFFNGEAQKELEHEKWIQLESNKFVKPAYNLDPTMQADMITKKILETIENNDTDFIVANIANTDMVGHTGNYEAAKVSAECVDYCVGKIFEKIRSNPEYILIITADHGNSDEMWDYEANQPHTRHTFNPVPLIVVTNDMPNSKNFCINPVTSEKIVNYDIPKGYKGELLLTDISRIISHFFNI